VSAFLSIACIVLLPGCGSSEATKESRLPLSDTSKNAQKPTPSSAASVCAAEPKKEGFTAHSDTIVAQIVSQKSGEEKRSATARANVPSPPPKGKYFVLQLGAFQQSANATRIGELFKKRSSQPVNLLFDPAVKMYRIMVGNFATKEEAMAFQAQLKKDFPKDYDESWVAEMNE
jgi:cell division septation protein DedD